MILVYGHIHSSDICPKRNLFSNSIMQQQISCTVSLVIEVKCPLIAVIMKIDYFHKTCVCVCVWFHPLNITSFFNSGGGGKII
jgi:hypothetical protein